jgi:basic membrane protein A
MKQRVISVLGLLLALLLMSGCAPAGVFKNTTGASPETRGEPRQSFPNVEAFSSPRPPATGEPGDPPPLRVGFVFPGRIGDYGFTYAQNQGRLALMRELGVETHVREMVTPDEVKTMIGELIDFGCTVIFSTSFGFMEQTAEVADANPDVFFFHCSGYITRDNMSAYFGRMYQIRYLTGIVAGLRTESNQIGYVAAFPIPEVMRGINAFALGVASVNPDAVINVSWSHTWHDTRLEKELTTQLIRAGADVIAQHQDTLLPQIAAEEAGVWSIGYNSPMGFFSPNAYLTGAQWDWTGYMVSQVRAIIEGTWQSSNYWGGIEDGVVSLEELTDNVAPGTREAVDAAAARLRSGFDVFVGPIRDNAGELRAVEGEILSDELKLSIDWLASNVREVNVR